MNNQLKNKVIQLTKPYKFELRDKNIKIDSNDIVVMPTLCYICAADLRYYTGNRRPEALKKKLPMALLHEGIGIVEESNAAFNKNDRVVLVPNIPGYVLDRKEQKECCIACELEEVGENYCENGIFISSGYDGLMQKFIVHPKECVVKIPDDVPSEIAALSELVTVSYEATKKVKINGDERIVVFGDGPVGYLMYCVLSFIYKIPTNNLLIIGTDESKLNMFEFAQKLNIRGDEPFYDAASFHPTYVFECVGGNNMGDAINYAIDIVRRGGSIVSMGVSEQNVAINMRDVLEKGLTIKGSSRSTRHSYPVILEYMRAKLFQDMLSKVICERRFEVDSIEVLKDAFDFAASKDYWGKIMLTFEGELYERK
ncbi:zinc-binding dehydrogenase [Clostridium omnivorum]|uniref:Ribitol-5-phosphate 2-dehydrogenase n=1 Tax=Clostridium omnivorum TaxID=1604902 RepID=A0ABQ5N0E5_9CLOT|nr:alcohol dehydrogenase catalytic domain-containing protein [Clostridium sp. E14]GLC28680.1 ribitol-5-phosphate 2-dehydrogenase [Clostridium sp. E14]